MMASCRQTATPATRRCRVRHMPSAGHMQGGTSSRPSRQTCRKKISSLVSAKKPLSGSTSSSPSTRGLQGSQKKNEKNSDSSLKKRSSRLISHGFRVSSRESCHGTRPSSKTANEPSKLHCSRSGAFLICNSATMKR